MDNPMLAELDEVVRNLPERVCAKAFGVKADGQSDDSESLQLALNYAAAVNFLRTHHATLADMAKRLEAAERDAARYRTIRLRLWPTEVQDALELYPAGAELDMESCEDHARQIDAAIDATQEGEG